MSIYNPNKIKIIKNHQKHIQMDSDEIFYPRQAVYGEELELPSSIICNKCKFLPLRGIHCKNCSRTTCALCLSKLNSKSSSRYKSPRGTISNCPKCSSPLQYLPADNLQRIYDLLRIKCNNYKKGCQVLLHPDLQEVADHHRNLCSYRVLQCVFCGEGMVSAHMHTHLLGCPKALLDCKVCLGTYVRGEKEGHDCILSLKDNKRNLTGVLLQKVIYIYIYILGNETKRERRII